MSEKQTTALSLKAAHVFGTAQGLEGEVHEIRDMGIEWVSSYTSSQRRGYIVELVEKHSLLEEFEAIHWAHGNTPAGKTK